MNKITETGETGETEKTFTSKEAIYNKLLTPAFLKSVGFSSAIRWWDKRLNQFRVSYKIKGYDCDILLSPLPQTHFDKTPEEQVNDFSDIEFLENDHVGIWHVFVNSQANHVASFNYQDELFQFMEICGCPLNGNIL